MDSQDEPPFLELNLSYRKLVVNKKAKFKGRYIIVKPRINMKFNEVIDIKANICIASQLI